MMFSHQPNTLVYIQRSSLLIAGKRISPNRFDFPAGSVKNMEVLQPDRLRSAVADWLGAADIRGKRVLVVLDASMVFDKTIPLDQSGQPDTLRQGFVDAVPFVIGQRACVSLINDTDLELYATNVEVYTTIVDALRQAGASKIVAVTPSGAYHLGPEDRTISRASERFFSDQNVLREGNFLALSPT